MRIDIDRLTEAELVGLNHRIVARLRFLQQARAHAEMLEFKIGEPCGLPADGGSAVRSFSASCPFPLPCSTCSTWCMASASNKAGVAEAITSGSGRRRR
jgi:hypothetical protein